MTRASFRFLHAADLHLDSPLRGLSRRSMAAIATETPGEADPVVDRIRLAPRAALDALVAQAIDDAVAFVLIAGDLYDGTWKDAHTGLFFAAQMARLARAGIPAFILHGNHDAASRLTRRLPLPDSVTTFSARQPETHVLEDLGVALHGQSYPEPEVTDNLVAAYPAPLPGRVNIGLLHTGLGGLGGHANYAPCQLDHLLALGYDYWALGHVHQGQIVHPDPPVVFPGVLQGRHIRETGPKGAVRVTVTDGRVTEVTPIALDVLRWAAVTVPMEPCATLADVPEAAGRALEAAIETEAEGRLLVCRVTLTGQSRLHGPLVAGLDQVEAEIRALAARMGPEVLWLEKVVAATCPLPPPPPSPAATGPAATGGRGEEEGAPETDAGSGDALAALRALLIATATDPDPDPDLVALLREAFAPLVLKLPAEIRAEADDPALVALLAGDAAGLIAALVPQALALLEQPEG